MPSTGGLRLPWKSLMASTLTLTGSTGAVAHPARMAASATAVSALRMGLSLFNLIDCDSKAPNKAECSLFHPIIGWTPREMPPMPAQLQSLLGTLALLVIAWSVSENRRRVAWRTVIAGLALQFFLA